MDHSREVRHWGSTSMDMGMSLEEKKIDSAKDFAKKVRDGLDALSKAALSSSEKLKEAVKLFEKGTRSPTTPPPSPSITKEMMDSLIKKSKK